MISVEEAKKLILESTQRLPAILQPVSKCLNHVLAEDIVAPIHYPPFDQSAMDGFAFIHSDFIAKKIPEIIGEAPAGKPFKGNVNSGETVRIFTGAKIPQGSDTVVMQENVLIQEKTIKFQDKPLMHGDNIRRIGSLVNKGDVVLKAGILLNAGAIGFLSSLGITSVNVFPKPKVSIVVTGDELQKPGAELQDGQIYESNSTMLIAALESIHVTVQEEVCIGDDPEETLSTLQSVIKRSDLVLVSGGVSVGKYDFVASSLLESGVENIFYKIFQKPGKPLFLGKYKECLIFGLPGNPAAALSCFYEYVVMAIKIMQGFSDIFLKKVNLAISTDIKKKAGLALFLKGIIKDTKVEALQGQDSNNIGSFAYADCLIYLSVDKADIKSGELVEVHLLP